MDPFTIELPPDAGTPRLARRAIDERVGAVPRKDDLLLCVSEVVTNAVLHAGTPRHLSAREIDGRLLVEVTDGDPRPPTPRHPDVTSATGRGLHLLDDLALAWGTRPLEDGKVVWFEFALNSGPVAAGGAATPADLEVGAVVVVVEQEVDLLTVAPLRARLAAALDGGATQVVVDLSACEFLDSTGIAVLVTTHLRLTQVGGRLEARGAQGAVARTLALSGLADLLAAGAP